MKGCFKSVFSYLHISIISSIMFTKQRDMFLSFSLSIMTSDWAVLNAFMMASIIRTSHLLLFSFPVFRTVFIAWVVNLIFLKPYCVCANLLCDTHICETCYLPFRKLVPYCLEQSCLVQQPNLSVILLLYP